MSQRKGLHRLLEIPLVYNFVQWIFAHKKTRNAWLRLVGDHEGKKILDVGCGPGKESIFFRNSKKYIGIDFSKIYINSAKIHYSKYGDFYCCSIEKIDKLPIKDIDLVVLKGVFHHLPDDVIDKFLLKIKGKMSAKGTICSVDPFFAEKKIFANIFVCLDRGKFVRKVDDLTGIISNHMHIKSQEITIQKFPPFQRILLEIQNKQKL
ncbi:MAG: SAM-dependent methyltransferase [Methylophilaceae bacterium]|jgi:SAM-dependent methyltransferase